MRYWRTLYRRVQLASKSEALLKIVLWIAKLYVIGFTITIPASKYLGRQTPSARPWFWGYAIALAMASIIPSLPTQANVKRRIAAADRLALMNVAIARLTEIIRVGECTEIDFTKVSQGLLAAMRLEVAEISGEIEGMYINVTLMTEDYEDSSRLRVVNRAIQNRSGAVYDKSDLLVWKAMENKRRLYQSSFSMPDKEYRCILAIPILAERSNQTVALGVISIDSGRKGDFDGLDGPIETRLIQYTSLMKLLLTTSEKYGGHHAGNSRKRKLPNRSNSRTGKPTGRNRKARP